MKGVPVLHVSAEKKWLHLLSRGSAGLVSMFISLLLLVQFWQFTLLKFLAWLIMLSGWALTVARLWQAERWRYRRWFLFTWFIPDLPGCVRLRYSLLAAAFWVLTWLVCWREMIWVAFWQLVGSELLLQAIAAAKAPRGYYELRSGEWLGLMQAGPGKDD